ncbi:unnamed protein product [Clonostachys rosea f. rosea IK726]|uniref:glucan 1,3-beta-glucosidase n=3 Tax=Bionectria ochroleuca TaxID=29856 RepID=A0A0B7KHN7_BIOOC|nr:unnamed protein product [Clonostachys rosea f. rosea IK726]
MPRESTRRLDKENARQKRHGERSDRKKKARRADYSPVEQEPRRTLDEDRDEDRKRDKKKKKKKRVVSGAVMEEGRSQGLRGGSGKDDWRWSDQSFEKQDYYLKKQPKEDKKKKKKKKLWIIIGCSVVALIIIIVVAVVVSQKNKNSDDGGSSSSSSGLNDKDRNTVPDKWKNTYLDPWYWQTTQDFNTTFTDEMVGDLPVMGLNSKWDDSKKANENVPALNEDWGSYADRPARGVNVGGWLNLEPFITPSLFNYDSSMGIIDEWTLCQHYGSSAEKEMEKHYNSFITESTFREIADAGFDHVRIPFGYWAVQLNDGDPYVFRISWRYLLRGIEYARKYGLRVNLDVHGLPGSQNGWNHSGRFGAIGWLNGTDGALNGQRSLDMHDKLSKFFAQDRYKNIITHYGLANEPRMVELDTNSVIQWTEKAYKLVRANGIKALVIFGDGFMGLENWQGKMTGHSDLVLDVHQYVLFNNDQLAFTRQKKVQYACDGWTEQTEISMNTSSGYGPTLFAEWSQSDTDCAPNLNGVGQGTRWEGTLASVDGPKCPTKNKSCSCYESNAGSAKWSNDYKKFLQMFAEAQMHSFEKGWGWWYWTWKTESTVLWSYELALKAGIMPAKAYKRDFNCDTTVPDFGGK